LTEAQEFLKMPEIEDADRNMLSSLIDKVSLAIKKYTDRVLVVQSTSTTEYLSGNGTAKLILHDWPVNSFTSLKIRDGSDFSSLSYNTTLTANTDYVVDYESGIIRAVGVGMWDDGYRKYQAIYKPGYAANAIPDDLKLGTLITIQSLWKKINTGMFSTTSQQIGDINLVYSQELFPDEAKRLIDNYRRLY